jgi:hypothetical protein
MSDDAFENIARGAHLLLQTSFVMKAQTVFD